MVKILYNYILIRWSLDDSMTKVLKKVRILFAVLQSVEDYIVLWSVVIENFLENLIIQLLVKEKEDMIFLTS